MFLKSIKKKYNKNLCNNTPPPPLRVNGAPYVPKLYASSGKDISKCNKGGTMKLATQVDYICICNVSLEHFRVMNFFYTFILFFLCFYFFLDIYIFFLNIDFFKPFFFYLVNTKALRETKELPI